MSKRIKQFRFNGTNPNLNAPETITADSLITGTIFEGYAPFTQLSIEALPGTKFYLNNSTQPIIIGNNGIFEIGPLNELEISSLSFAAQTVYAAQENGLAQIIVNILYDTETVGA